MLTVNQLREVLSYNPNTGLFFWLKRTARRTQVGELAGYLTNGYIRIKLYGIVYQAHQLAWLHYYGEWAGSDIDHKDTIRSHNWITNLRRATASQNIANSNLSLANSTGFKGVDYHSITGKYRARLTINRKQLHLGEFDTREEAAAAYKKAAKEMFGEFANDGEVKC